MGYKDIGIRKSELVAQLNCFGLTIPIPIKKESLINCSKIWFGKERRNVYMQKEEWILIQWLSENSGIESQPVDSSYALK